MKGGDVQRRNPLAFLPLRCSDETTFRSSVHGKASLRYKYWAHPPIPRSHLHYIHHFFRIHIFRQQPTAMSHEEYKRASAVAELGEELFDKRIVLPEGELSQEYSWQPGAYSWRRWKRIENDLYFVFTEQQNFLPPHAEDYKDSETRKAFNDYIKEKQPSPLYVTLPPMPDQKCHNLRPREYHRHEPTECNYQLQSWNRIFLSRTSTGYKPWCLTHESKDAHKVMIAAQTNSLREFREFRRPQEVQRICQTLFGWANAPLPTMTYGRDQSANLDYMVDTETKKFLPPKATDLEDPKSCAQFYEFVKVADPELIYTTISPLSNPPRCQYTDCYILPSKEYQSRQCPLQVPSGSQAVLHQLSKGHYQLWCLGHASLDVHTANMTRQEKDILKTTSQGNTADSSGFSDSAVKKTDDMFDWEAYLSESGHASSHVKHEDADDKLKSEPSNN